MNFALRVTDFGQLSRLLGRLSRRAERDRSAPVGVIYSKLLAKISSL